MRVGSQMLARVATLTNSNQHYPRLTRPLGRLSRTERGGGGAEAPSSVKRPPKGMKGLKIILPGKVLPQTLQNHLAALERCPC